MAAEFPQAPFRAILGSGAVAERMGVADRWSTTLPESRSLMRGFRALTPAYPAIVAARKLPEADVLLTSSYAFAHGYHTENDAPQVCYCYSPLRVAWSMSGEYAGEERRIGAAIRAFAPLMRAQDLRAARRVDRYVAESRFIARQIKRFYGRESEVIYPPVDCEKFRPSGQPEDYYLFCGRLIEPYKKPSIVVEAFRRSGRRLLIAGDGPERARLQATAPSNVEFLGQLGDDELVDVMGRCAAVVFPSCDDFGLIPVEVMACGRPVLAYAAGGALETVLAGDTGEFFVEQSVDCLCEALDRFDPDAYDPARIRARAEEFSADRFGREIGSAVRRAAAP